MLISQPLQTISPPQSSSSKFLCCWPPFCRLSLSMAFFFTHTLPHLELPTWSHCLVHFRPSLEFDHPRPLHLASSHVSLSFCLFGFFFFSFFCVVTMSLYFLVIFVIFSRYWFYFYSRWCPRRVPWKPPLVPKGENHFPTGILQWNLHYICTGYIKWHFCEKKIKYCSDSKWRPHNRLLFCVISILAKFWKKKNFFQRNFSMKFGSKKENIKRFTILK